MSTLQYVLPQEEAAPPDGRARLLYVTYAH